MSASDRLKKAREWFGKTQKEMAAFLGVSYRTYQNYEDGVNAPGWDTCNALSNNGININWLLTGEGPMKRGEWTERETNNTLAAFVGMGPGEGAKYPLGDDLQGAGYVHVPRFDIAASAGGGAVVHSEQVVDYLAFRKEWLQGSLGVSPSSVAVISVMGDSMEPYLADGDLILVDTSVTRIENNAVYVIHVDGSLLVKRIQKKIDGTVIVKSDNEHYEPEVFRGEATELLRVVGKMVRRLVR